MLVMVDGAHGVLAQDLDMSRLETAGIDFYIGNCHKWLSCPRGAAMVYCPNEDLRDSVLRIPPVISHGVDDGYVSRFLWDGCRDYAAQLSLPVVLEYWTKLKTENVRRQMRRITENAVRIVTHLWHPHLGESSGLEEMSAVGITLAPVSMHSPLVTIRLPDFINNGGKRTSADAKDIQDYLYSNGVECPIKCINGILYVRLSCHIYNTLEQYERLARVILGFPKQF